MPIFDNEITFIHIPKCGGSSIEYFLQDNGYKIKLFSLTGSVFINGHTPQHCTFRELDELGLLTEKIFTVVRPEVDRVVSEFFYIQSYRPDLNKLFKTFDDFLEIFLNKNNYSLFDYHNVPNKEFLINKDGFIDSNIKIFDFLDIGAIERYLGISGLSGIHELKSKRNNFLIRDQQIKKIKKFYGKDS